MATRVGGVFVNITANASAFQKQLRRAGASVQTFSGKLTGIAKRIGGLRTALAGIVAGGSFAYMTKRAFETVDALAKVSDKLGIATEDLQALRHAADLSGVASSNLDTALQRMTRRISEAANGTGEAKDAIKELGLNAKQLKAAGPAGAMKRIADAMARVESQSDRVRLAFKLFDTEGVALVNLFQDGSKAIRDAEAELNKFGIRITRFDAAKVEQAVNVFTALKTITSGLAQKFAVELSPLAIAFGEKLVEAAGHGKSFGQSVADGMKHAALAVGKVADQIDDMIYKWAAFQVATHDGADKVDKGVGLVAALLDVLTYRATGKAPLSNIVGGRLDEDKKRRDAAVERLGFAMEELENSSDRSSRIMKWFDDLNKRVDDASRKMQEAAERRNKLGDMPLLDDEDEKEKRQDRINKQTSFFDDFANDGGIKRIAGFLGGQKKTETRNQEKLIKEQQQTNSYLRKLVDARPQGLGT